MGWMLVACGLEPDPQTPGPGDLQPYSTQTPGMTATVYVRYAETALPTPTPFIHVVASGETMGGIALKYGISQEALQLANPDINPTILSIGQELRIPSGLDVAAGEATVTPEPVAVLQASCYPTVDGGLWCYTLVHNEFNDPVENLSAQITLVDADGKVIASRAAFSPLSILPAGQSIPLTAYFPNVSTGGKPRVQLLTSIRLTSDNERYLPASLQKVLVEVDWDGRKALVSGQITLLGENKTANHVWLAAVAYDAKGEVVGMRRWEAEKELQVGEMLPFEFVISSLAAPIERVELVVEARP